MHKLAVSTKLLAQPWRTQQAARLEARVARERAVEAVGEDGDQVAVQQAQLLRQRRHRLARRRDRHQVQRPALYEHYHVLPRPVDSRRIKSSSAAGMLAL